MTIRTDLKIKISIDDVFRAQGAEPDVLRKRSPRLVENAKKALEESVPLLKPVIIYKWVKVEEIRHEEIILAGGKLTSPLLPRHLAGASDVIISVCSIGEELEDAVSKAMADDVSLGYTMDAVGTVAADTLGDIAYSLFRNEANQKGLSIGRSMSPGMIDWPIDVGQPQIFNLLRDENKHVHLSHGMQMIPRKSTSFIVGIGKDMENQGLPCDFCAQKETCIYKRHEARK